MKNIKINVNTKSIFLFFGVGFLLFICYQTIDVLLLVFGSYVIASSLLPPINFLSKKMPRTLAVFVVYVFVFVCIITLLVPMFSLLTSESLEFINQMPSLFKKITLKLNEWHIDYRNTNLLPDIDNITSLITSYGDEIWQQTLNITHNIFVAIVMYSSLAILVLF
ncbi:MAG: AI-2E family transporter, partial [Vampirovibrionia bacterium]